MTREEFWAQEFTTEGRRSSVLDAASWADRALAEYDARFPPPTLDAAMDKAVDEEIGKLRALVLRGTALAVRLQQVVCAHLCDDSAGRTRHHTDCVDVRQWLVDCRAEGLE